MAQFDGMNERQYEDLYREDDVPISNVRSGALRLLFYTCFGTVGALIIASVFLTIPREVVVPFSIKSDTREVNYRFSENTRVERMYVKPGVQVKVGDTLARIRSASIAALLNQLSTAIDNRKMFESSEVPINRNEKESLSLQRSRYQSQINDAKKERQLKLKKQSSETDNLQQELTAATKHLTETKKLFSQGFAADREVRDAQLKVSNATDALNRVKQQYSIELSTLDQRIKQYEIDQSMVGVNSSRSDLELGSKRAQLDAAISALRAKIKDVYGDAVEDNGALLLRSAYEQRVSYAYDEDHELAAGAVMLKLMSAPSKIYAASSVQPQHIGTLRVGLSAALKVSSFPYYHWGLVRGVITHLSITPDDKGDYPVEIEIVDAGQLSSKLQIGMTGEVDLLVEDRSLASYVFDQVAGRFR